MSHERPIRVFTDLKNHPKPQASRRTLQTNVDLENQVSEGMNLNASDRQITVSGTGDLVLPPDRFAVTIKYKASKDNFQEAKNSVTRRLEYIVQTLKNNSLKEEDFRVFQHTGHEDSMVNIDCEVETQFTDLNKCQHVSNLLVEKLGPCLHISLPHCYHAKGSIEKLRKQSSMLAIHNARQKAGEMARVLHLSVGSALHVEEKGTTETFGPGEKNGDDIDLSPSIHKNFEEATLYISSKVFVSFQLKAAKSRKL